MSLRDQLMLWHPELPDWMGEYLEEHDFAWHDLVEGRLWRDPNFPFNDLETFQQYTIYADPVRFGECCLLETEGDIRQFRYYDYQKASLRLRCNLLNQGAPETGKSREILTLLLHTAITRPRSGQLVAGSLYSHALNISRKIEEQARINPLINTEIDWRATTKSPYVDLVFKNGSKIYFRPAGSYGSALRSHHVKDGLFFDEAPLSKHEKVLGNFLSRAQKGCPVRIYGTPDGDRECWFYRLCESLPEEDPYHPRPRGTGKDGEFIRIRWSLPMSPDWTPERERAAIDAYGGRDSSEYQRQIEGKWGDPPKGVFRWSLISRCLTYVPEYTVLKLFHDDEAGRVLVEAHRLNPRYKVRARESDEDEGNALILEAERELRIDGYEEEEQTLRVDRWRRLLSDLLTPLPGSVVYGVDFGSRKDVTEILGSQVNGSRRRWVRRIQLRRFRYVMQADLLHALNLFDRPSHGWGLERTSVGTAVEDFLRVPVAGSRLQSDGFPANGTTEEIDPRTQKPLVDEKTGKVRTVSYKDLGTRLLEIGFEGLRYEIPWDPDIQSEFPRYVVVREGAHGRIFSKKHDHLVAAAQVLELRLWRLRHRETTTPEVRFKVVGTSRSHRLARDLGVEGPLRIGYTAGLRELFS